MTFPGGTSISQLRVYDWPASDGLRGGSPHLHTASAEGYLVLRGEGAVQTLSQKGYQEHALEPGRLLWFTPGTVHRLVTSDGELELVVVMQNSGLPEAGDAVLTFPPEVLADPVAYARAAFLTPPEPDAAWARRDLALAGFLELRKSVAAQGPSALAPLYRAAAALVRDRVGVWAERWREGALAQAEATGHQLQALAQGRADHLAEAAVYEASARDRLGMCGHLQTWST